MSLIIKHSFTSPKLDGPDPTVVRPSNWNDDHVISGSGWLLAGMVVDFIGHTTPSYLLECYGQSVPAVTYPLLFSALVKQSTVTLTISSPGVVNWVGHGLGVGSKVRFRTTGALPTGIVSDTDYYIVAAGYTTAAFQVAAAPGDAGINFTGSQSGIQTAINAQYGVSSDLSTFTVPDLRGRVTAGLDNMGGTAANRLTAVGGVTGTVLGAVGGAETHTLTTAQIAAHQHNNVPPNPTVDISGLAITVSTVSDHTHTLSGTNVAALDHTHAGSGGTIGSGGAHSHTLAGNTGDDSPDHAHYQQGRMYGATYGGAGAHTHSVTDAGGRSFEKFDSNTSSGGRGIVQEFAGGGTDQPLVTGAAGVHEHSAYVDLNGGTTGATVRHVHSLTSGVAVAVGDHTHPVTGLTIAAGGAHNHVWSGAAVGAGGHTHTATPSGTATSTLANFLSDAAGGGAAHPNVQPTFVVRKLLYVG